MTADGTCRLVSRTRLVAARFADGQRKLAIYVPLRNDLLKEEDETFKVCLRAPRQARIGGKSCAEATIRDDDQFFLSPSDSMTRS